MCINSTLSAWVWVIKLLTSDTTDLGNTQFVFTACDVFMSARRFMSIEALLP